MLTGSTARLEMAAGYGVAAAAAVTPDRLSGATPCQGWDLNMLLLHAIDSMDALAEGFGRGRIGVLPATLSRDCRCDLRAAFTERAGALVGMCALSAGDGDDELVTVADRVLGRDLLAAAGALEIAMHGWDIFQACGRDEPIPERLALDFLRLAPSLITAADRGQLFAWPVVAPAGARPSDRLAAFLGREPGHRVDTGYATLH